MPPKPMFQNEATRRSVIAAVMLLLLMTSISLAYLTTITRRIKVDGLAVSIPRRWTNDNPPTALRSRVGDVAVYHSDSIQSPRLIIAALRPRQLRSSDAALAVAMGALGITPWEAGSKSRLRLGNITAQLFIAMRHIQTRNQKSRRLNMLAVVTQDDRRYWLIYLTTNGSGASSLTDPRQNREFAEILRSVEIQD